MRSSLLPPLTELKGIVIPDDATIESLVTALMTVRKATRKSLFVHERITSEWFKVTVHGPRRLYLAHFNEVMACEDVAEKAIGESYKLGLIEDLLCVGAHPDYRDLLWDNKVFALGSYTFMDDYKPHGCGGYGQMGVSWSLPKEKIWVPSLCGYNLELDAYYVARYEGARFLLVGRD